MADVCRVYDRLSRLSRQTPRGHTEKEMSPAFSGLGLRLQRSVSRCESGKGSYQNEQNPLWIISLGDNNLRLLVLLLVGNKFTIP